MFSCEFSYCELPNAALQPPPPPPVYIGGVVIFEKSERGADQDFFVKMGEGVSIVCVFGGKGG